MIKKEFKPYFHYYNPYQANKKPLPSGNCSLEHEKRPKILRAADVILNWSGSFFFRDYEKQVDLVGKVAKGMDWGVFFFVGGIQSAIVASKLFSGGPTSKGLSNMSLTLQVPTAATFLGFGTIEALAEFSNLHRVLLLHRRLKEHQENPVAALHWIKAHYFSLRANESKKIQSFVEKTLGETSLENKSSKFQQIANKILFNRFYSLQNRITPGLATEVGDQLSGILRDLKSWNPLTRQKAHFQAKEWIESLSRQTKNKIIVHILGLLAIGMSLLSMILFLTGAVGIGHLILLSILSTAFMLVRFLVEKRTLDREVDLVHNRLASL